MQSLLKQAEKQMHTAFKEKVKRGFMQPAVNRLITTDPPQNVVWPTKPFTRGFESFHNLWLYTEGDST